MYGNIEQNEDDEKNQIELIQGVNMDSKNKNEKKISNQDNSENIDNSDINEESNDNDNNDELSEEKNNYKNIELKNNMILSDENLDTNIMQDIYGNIYDEINEKVDKTENEEDKENEINEKNENKENKKNENNENIQPKKYSTMIIIKEEKEIQHHH